MGSRGAEPLRDVATPGFRSWELPRDPAAASLARRQLAAALPDLPTEPLQDAQLLTSELVTNALRHGAGLITMSVVRDEDDVTVRIADQGSQAPAMREHDVAAQAGRGLQLVDKLTTRWGVEPLGDGSEGKVVWFSVCTATRLR